MILTFEDLECLASDLACDIQSPTCITLSGDLGTGKSTFARAFIRTHLNNKELFVPSPTFTLVQHYISDQNITIVHSDWYRLTHETDVWDLDISFDQAITLIEWPHIGKSILPFPRIELTFEWIDEHYRRVECKNRLS